MPVIRILRVRRETDSVRARDFNFKQDKEGGYLRNRNRPTDVENQVKKINQGYRRGKGVREG